MPFHLGLAVNDVAFPYAQVAVLSQMGKAGGLFTYGLPASLAPLVGPGSLVRIPFRRQSYQGIVFSLEETTSLPRVRDIAELLDPTPVVNDHQLKMATWIATYYAAPLSDVVGAMLPPGIGRKTVYVLQPAGRQAGDTLAATPESAESTGRDCTSVFVLAAADIESPSLEPITVGATPRGYPEAPALGFPSQANSPRRLTPDQQKILDLIQQSGRIPQDDLQRRLPGIDVERALTSLVRRGLVERLSELAPPRVASRTIRLVAPTDLGREALAGTNGLGRAPKQRQILEYLAEHGPVSLPSLSQLIPKAQTVIGALEKKGYVALAQQEARRSPLAGKAIPTTQPLTLAPAQTRALEAIVRALHAGRPDIFLLHGVTGSGKTEVYLQAIAETLRRGKQAIMMVPEISLTPQAVERVAGRFPGRVAVLHSKLSDGERVDEWQRIRHGEVDVVVGPRSALFAPLKRVGLIVVDEEHDPSYKQDASPRYHARDAAAVLARIVGATVVFGSATPDIGTYQAAKSGRIHLLELPERPVWGAEGRRAMPPVEIVDMRQELKLGNRSIFSQPLLTYLEETLRQKHQALLFLNRRGSATVVLCRDCGYVVRCPNCDIPFTYHAAATRLLCHRCDKRMVSPRICPVCKGPRIRYLGVGTQRVEEEVTRLFPQAGVLRWDRDVTGGKDAHDDILRRFSRHQADILVGTQMIAKGLDFPLVTLVGVISADTGLHLPDFRAPERSFQLLTQVAGRAGRSTLPSRVVVQTYNPDHYAILAARDHDYHRFFHEEMSFRQAARYPPYARLIRFVYSSENEASCHQSAENLRALLRRAIAEQELSGAELIGPAPCFVARVKNRYYWQLIARSGQPGEKGADLHPLLDYVPAGWAIDVDPVDLL